MNGKSLQFPDLNYEAYEAGTRVVSPGSLEKATTLSWNRGVPCGVVKHSR